MEYVMVGVVVLVILVAVVFTLLNGAGQPEMYKARKLMTDNEAEFFARMVQALPDHYVFPQVAMSALLQPANSDKKRAHSDRLRIAQQRTDYVVCDRNCKVIAVVELDDKTHSAAKDQVRDARLAQGGIRTIRFQSKNKPTGDMLRAAIFPPVSTAEVAKGESKSVKLA